MYYDARFHLIISSRPDNYRRNVRRSVHDPPRSVRKQNRINTKK